jgi:hypothetical protein
MRHLNSVLVEGKIESKQDGRADILCNRIMVRVVADRPDRLEDAGDLGRGIRVVGRLIGAADGMPVIQAEHIEYKPMRTA